MHPWASKNVCVALRFVECVLTKQYCNDPRQEFRAAGGTFSKSGEAQTRMLEEALCVDYRNKLAERGEQDEGKVDVAALEELLDGVEARQKERVNLARPPSHELLSCTTRPCNLPPVAPPTALPRQMEQEEKKAHLAKQFFERCKEPKKKKVTILWLRY